ncbi:Formate/nitrite transporter [Hortaea werneckii]|uniref:Formate/nitrite transporter n=1 Tax=Hortaea werneckii TaxID=91943 RepID=A0A3M7G193_HORWE|nr:Formate/nitrite transporter [Hortaea werneckii]KAI7192047.1 Formate/nitrite transporter [Hortaea werneckii]KAI7557297.1 Formate/nitrite transporter [Hortaea werneckii]KAI7607625.1 Formate/nitrite transporter [Hortaea werneckii]KAI7613459.1 Formate/nitrite transporter [Hortaea werneckii]
MYMHVVNNCYSAKETVELCSRAGVMKANMRLDKIFMSAVMAGCLLSFACAAVLITETAPWYQENAPGLIRMIGALIFPFGLVSIVVMGADLCTGSFLYATLAVLHRRISLLKMLIHWTVTFFGNLAGSLFVMAIIAGYGGVFSAEPYYNEAESFATTKVVTPGWHQIFLRGIGANWLVCLACFLAFMAREYFSKVVAIWWPTFAFVTLGFDHVVANMFFVPLAIFLGSEEVTVGYYIWESMIPALIGNIFGGGLFVGVVYWYLYLTGDTAPIPIDGNVFGSDNERLVGQETPENSNEDGTGNEERKSAERMV